MENDANNKGGGVGLPMGSKVGKYEVRQRLGVGGQSIVYKCYDAMLDRYVAVKQISSHLAEDPRFLERFRKEAQILAKLGDKQSAIVSIHELVEDERGLFIIMEFVEGHTLETIMEQAGGPIDPKMAVQILWRLAAALSVVHSAGIVHRDIKPANIIVADGMQPKITDFGVAASMTGQTSMLLGTTKYMAPELFAGGNVDQRVDIYSLGFVGYEMFAGRNKFKEIFADIVRDKHTEALRWMKWHSNDAVQAPRLSAVNPEVSPGMSGIVAKMIAKNVAQRYASMEEVGKAMKVALAGKSHGKRESAFFGSGLAGMETSSGKGGAAGDLSMQTGGPGVQQSSGAAQVQTQAAGGASVDPAPTAALPPKSSLSKRTKLILSSVIGVSLLAMVVMMLLPGSDKKEAKTVAENYKTAEGIYENTYANCRTRGMADAEQSYEKAKVMFEAIKVKDKKFPREAAKSDIMIHFCQAQILLEKAVASPSEARTTFWKESESQEERAYEKAREFQRRFEDKDSVDWSERWKTAAKNLETERQGVRAVVEAFDRVDSLLASQKFDDARKELEQLAAPGATHQLTEKQRGEISVKRKKINIDDARNNCQVLMATADKLWKEQNPAAEVAFKQVQEYLDNREDEKLAAWAKECRTEFENAKQHVSEQLKAITGDLREQAMVKIIRDKNAAGDIKGELQAIKEYLQKYPSRGSLYAGRIEEIEINFMKNDARAMADPVAAIVAWNAVLARKPGDPEAAAAIAKINADRERQQKISAAEKAFQGKEYDKAIELYQSLLQEAGDQALSDRLKECRVERHRGLIDSAIKTGKPLDDVFKLIDELVAIDASLAQQGTAWKKSLQDRADYLDYVAKAKGFIDTNKWALAIKEYEKARNIYPNDAQICKTLDMLIAKTHYAENLHNGINLFQQKDYIQAGMQFNIARRWIEPYAKELPGEIKEITAWVQKNDAEKQKQPAE